MADISKVQVGETQYDIKDETARGKVAGHVIKNASGTTVTQRVNMQFKTAAVTDENGETVIRNVVQVTQEQYDALPESKNSDGIIYDITDATVVPAVVETVPIAQGGTGATTAAAARTNLGLGTAATKDSTTSVTDGGTGLPTSGAVYSAIDDVRTDLSNYHVAPSRNKMQHVNASGSAASVAYNLNSDLSYTANGTATGGNSWYNIWKSGFTLPAGDYVLANGLNPLVSADKNLRTSIRMSDGTYLSLTGVDYYPITLTASYQIIEWSIGVANGTQASNYLFQPMIYTAADYAADPSYEPYWVDYKDFSTVKDGAISYENGISQTMAAQVPIFKVGSICILNVDITGVVVSQNTWINIGTIPVGFRPTQLTRFRCMKNASTHIIDAYSYNGPDIQIRDNSGSIAAGDTLHLLGVYYSP